MSSLTNVNTDWRLTTIGEEFDIRLGKMLDEKKNVGQLKPYVGNRSVQWGCIDTSDLSTMALSIEDQKTYRLKQGDLLVCEGGEVGRCAIWNSTMECYYQKAIHRLRSKNGYRADLLAYYFEYWTSHDLLGDFVTKTSIAHLTKEKLAEIPLPVPSQQEQNAIASALSDMDALLAKLDQLIAKKRDIKQAAMQELLTGRRRLPGFSDVWRTQKLRDGISLLSGQHVLAEHCNTDGIGCPYITGPSDFQDGKIQHSKCTTSPTTLCQADDILITVKGSGVGAMVMSDSTYCISRQLMAIRVDSDWCTQFIHQLLQQDASLIGAAATGLIPGISRSDILNKEIHTPRAAEQTAIAAVLSDMDTEITALEARREKTRLLKQGMMQELLSGRVRLI